MPLAIARKNEAAFGLELRDKKHVGNARERGKDASHMDVLVGGQDAFSAVMASVIDEVVGVPSGAARAHLD